jgi:predicted PurR-regulated permease PerM
MSYPNDFQKRTIWSALTGLAIVLLGIILVGVIWLGGQVLGYLQPVLVPLAVAGITAYLLDPVVGWLQRNRKLSRLKAVLVVFGAFTVIVALFFSFLIPKLIEQGGSLVDDREQLGERLVGKLDKLEEEIPGAETLVTWLTHPLDKEGEPIPKPDPFSKRNADGKFEGYFNSDGEKVTASKAERQAVKDYEDTPFNQRRIGFLLQEKAGLITATLLDWLKATTKVFGLLGYLLGFLLVPVYLYYFLNESSKIKASWHQYIPLKASKFKDEVVSTLSEINGYLISFFRGQVLVSLIDGILVGIALSIFQLPYGFLIGLSLAVLGILPFIGNILCMIPAALIAFIHFGGSDANHQWLGDSPWAYVGAVIGIFLVVQQINSLVTAPKIVGDSVGLHPMTVIFSILFWSLILGGFLGALLAVPLTAAVKVLFSRYIWQARVSPQLNAPSAEQTTSPT